MALYRNSKRMARDHDDPPSLSDFIKPTDQAQAVARPANIGEFYVETEHKHAADEQLEAHKAKGKREARPAREQVAGAEHDADKAIEASNMAQERLRAHSDGYNTALRVLRRHVRRTGDWKYMKYGRMALILLGDIAAISGAALLLGEEPVNAFMQAVSAATAVVTLGAIGREVRYVASARERAKPLDELTDDEKKYAHMFCGPRNSEGVVKIVAGIGVTGMALIGGGIFALRAGTEGTLAGVAFGCFALALGLASFINAYDTTDLPAELLDNEGRMLEKAEDDAKAAREAAVIKQRAAAKAQAESIHAENEAEGQAVAAGIKRRCQAALNNSPGVAGNGTAATPANRSNGHHKNRKVDLSKTKAER